MAPAGTRLDDAGTGEEESLFLDPLGERSIVYGAAGEELATLYGEQNRVSVSLDEVPEEVRAAIIAVEDEHFYEHKGVNVRAFLRALMENVSAGGVEQGGSTITMQVVKNSVLGNTESLERKFREAVLATRLEEEFTKDQILERYLNTAYFGNGAYGVQAAAETYWGVDVGELGWAEAALLAALIRNPNNYEPIRHPEIAAERRRLALRRLVDTGKLDAEDADVLGFEPLPTEIHRVTEAPDDYFVEQVKQLLLDDPRFGLGDTPEERYNAVFSGGLRVHTTFDSRMQELALQARSDILPGDDPGAFTFRSSYIDRATNRRVTGDFEGSAAVVTVDVETGAVRAMVGGPGFDRYQYNIATQGTGRQPGSSWKTFVLAAAFESGLVPNDIVRGDGPCRIPNVPEDHIANNFGRSAGGSGTITSQTQRSSNCAFLRLGQIVGLEKVAETATRMGITTPIDPFPAMPIGSEEVYPVDMAAAYASLANDGVYNEPYYVQWITDAQGNVIYEHAPDGRRAVSRQTARLATRVLQANVAGGTGTRARVSTQPTAGKTGTTQESADGWFVGYTPQYATAVWIGSTTRRVAVRIDGGLITGGAAPARLWGQYMNAVLADTPRGEFPEAGPTRSGRGLRMAGETAAPDEEDEESTTTSSIETTEPAPPTTPTTRGGPDPTPTTLPTTIITTPPPPTTDPPPDEPPDGPPDEPTDEDDAG